VYNLQMSVRCQWHFTLYSYSSNMTDVSLFLFTHKHIQTPTKHKLTVVQTKPKTHLIVSNPPLQHPDGAADSDGMKPASRWQESLLPDYGYVLRMHAAPLQMGRRHWTCYKYTNNSASKQCGCIQLCSAGANVCKRG